MTASTAGEARRSYAAAAATDLDNRSRLLRAATDAFAEFGYEGTSLRAIADNAEVSFQLIAYYFGSSSSSQQKTQLLAGSQK